MPRYKRNAAEAELDVSALETTTLVEPAQNEVLSKLRNMWEFASLMQYIYLFGNVVRIDEDFDIEYLEQECLQHAPSEVLASMGLALLKYVSSHRGLTADIFAEYTRRQYIAKLPSQNPFGDGDEPIPFNDLDIYTRIRVLQQLSIWTFNNADRIRGLMPEEDDHLSWRIEPLGWDAEDRSYFVLDDNRLYRRTDVPLPPPTPVLKPKKVVKKKVAPKPTRGTRTSKRRKVEESPEPEEDEEEEDVAQDVAMTNGDAHHDKDQEDNGYGFTDKTWELIAITLADYQEFLATIQRSRDANEKLLRRRIEEEVLPIIEKRAEAIRQKQLKKLRELENIEKMATAKRSSRLADKADKAAKEEEVRQAELKKIAELRMAHEEQDRQKRIEEGHESRRLTREQRLKEREVKRILHEEELERLDREASASTPQPGTDIEAGTAERKRLSSRNLQNQQEAHRKELERLTQDQAEDKWYFDCVVCGMHGENLDDGSHSVACERCNVWQHSNCHGFTPEQCEDENFHFICNSCRKQEKAAREQKSGIILKLGKQSSPQTTKAELNGTAGPVKRERGALPDFVQQQLEGMAQQRHPHMHSASPPQQIAQHTPPQQYGQQQHSQPGSLQSPSRQQSYQQQPHPAQSASMYPHPRLHANPPMHAPMTSYTPNRGFAGTPPQRTQQWAPSPGPHHVSHLGQHNSVHQSAASGAGMHVPRSHLQQSVQPQAQSYPMPPQTPAYHAASHPQSLQNGTVHSQLVQCPSQHQANGAQDHTPRLPQQSMPSPQRTPQHPVVQASQGALPSSPHTSFPPPTAEYNRQAAISPVKSSPPRPAEPSPQSVAPSNGYLANPAHPAYSAGTTKTVSPSTSFENAPKLATPNKTVDVPVNPGQNPSDLAAHGMQGPWPNGSLSVPHKQESHAQVPKPEGTI